MKPKMTKPKEQQRNTITNKKAKWDIDPIIDVLIALKARLTDPKEQFAVGFAIGELYASEHMYKDRRS